MTSKELLTRNYVQVLTACISAGFTQEDWQAANAQVDEAVKALQAQRVEATKPTGEESP